MRTSNHVPLVMHIPPPLWFAAAFLAGWGLQHLVPLTIHSPKIVSVSHAIGFGLLVCGALLALSCLGLFLIARTTFIPFARSSSLVTRGPYRLSRNPMYVSLLLAYLGFAGSFVQPWSLILLPIPLAIMNWIVIPFEEAGLQKTFGGAYEEYRAKVRRWI